MSVLRTHPQARELSAGGHVDCPVGDEAPKGRGLAGPGRSLVSTALTLTPYRRCTPERNRSIPTIPAGCFDGRLGSVGAVDTGPRRSESGVLAARPGAPVTGPPPPFPARRPRRVWWSGFGFGPSQSWPDLARVGLLHEGRDLLAKGCAYCTKAPPTRSAPDPPPVAPHSRAVHPGDAVSRHSDQDSPSSKLKQQISHVTDAPHRCLEMS